MILHKYLNILFKHNGDVITYIFQDSRYPKGIIKPTMEWEEGSDKVTIYNLRANKKQACGIIELPHPTKNEAIDAISRRFNIYFSESAHGYAKQMHYLQY